jgi:hypothetical protein
VTGVVVISEREPLTQPPGNMPSYPYPEYPAQPPTGPPANEKNTVGLIALIVAIIGFVFACIPGALIVGWILLPIAFVLSIVGLCLSGKSKGTSIAAVIVTIVGTIVGVMVFLFVVGDAFSDAFDSDGDSSATTPASEDQGSSAGGGGEDQPDVGADPGSRENPYPVGQTVGNQDWQVTIAAPREAGTEVAAENQFNETPDPGMEFWVVPVTAVYTGGDTGNPAFEVRVKFVGSDNRTYDDSCGVIPDPLDDVGELYPGGTAQGNKCVAVPAGADGLWAVSTGLIGDPVFIDGG